MKEYEDKGVSGLKARRPGLDALMADARQRKFNVVLVAAFDRVARSTRHFLCVLDELESLGIEFISQREGVATGDAMGRQLVRQMPKLYARCRDAKFGRYARVPTNNKPSATALNVVLSTNWGVDTAAMKTFPARLQVRPAPLATDSLAG